MTVDRSDAVNLVFGLREYGDNAIHKITMHGLRCLFDAIERMDAALKTAPSERGEVPPQFKAVGFVDHEGTVHWEPGRKPTKEMMLYVADGKRG